MYDAVNKIYYFSLKDTVQNLQNIDLLFGGYWLEVTIDSYIWCLSNYNCYLNIAQSPTQDAVLGVPFLKNFYV